MRVLFPPRVTVYRKSESITFSLNFYASPSERFLPRLLAIKRREYSNRWVDLVHSKHSNLTLTALYHMSLKPVKIGSLTCIPLHPLFAAEIQGVDFSQSPLPDHVIQDIITAQDRFGVTVYRDTGLNDQTHVAFSSQLGALEMCPKLGGPNQPPRFSEPALFDAGNTDRDGNLILKGTRRWWYKCVRVLYIKLYSIETTTTAAKEIHCGTRYFISIYTLSMSSVKTYVISI